LPPYGCQEVPRARQSLQAERAERARELEQQWCRKPRRAFTLASSLRAAEADLAAVMTLRLITWINSRPTAIRPID